MIKITVEEIEILVTAKVDKEIKKIEPEIRKIVNKIKKELNSIKEQDITVAIDTKTIEPKIKKVKEKIKEVFDPNDTTGMKIQMNAFKEIDRNIKGVVKNAKNYKAELGTLGNTLEKVKFKDMAPNLKINSNNQDTKLNQMYNEWGQGKVSLAEIKKYKKEHQDISKEVNNTANKYGLWSNILARYYALLDHAKNKISQIRKTTIETGEGQKKWGTFLNTFKEKMGSSFKMLPNILIKANTKINQITNRIKSGIGQVLKYAGALFSLHGIYNVLNNSAQSWLSSQNIQAKQLSANIEYMKYAMGSAFAPAIQYVTSLVYKLMKAIQTVIYSLFKVNIFANASANSYASMANSAKSAAKETKQLASIDEINNIGGNDNDSSSSGSGNVAPNFDLSNVDTNLVDIVKSFDFNELLKKINQKLETIDFGEIGKNIAKKINDVINYVDWTSVGNTIGLAIQSAIDISYNFVTTFEWEKFGISIGKIVNGCFEKIDFKEAGETLGKSIAGIVESITGFLKEVNWEKIGQDIANFVVGIKWVEVGKAFVNAIIESVKAVQGIGKGIIKGLIQGIVKDLTGKEIADNVLDPILDQIQRGTKNVSLQMILGGAFSGLGSIIGSIFTSVDIESQVLPWYKSLGENLIQKMIEGINNAKDDLTTKWNTVKTWFSDIKKEASIEIKTKWKDIKQKWYNVTKNIKNKTASMKAKIGTKWKDIKQKWYNITNNIKNKTASMKAKIGTKWKDVKNTWNDLMSNFKDKIISVNVKIQPIIDNVRNWLNTHFIDKVNSHIPGWMGQIPRLATGNVATEETLAIFGEYSNARTNPEITAPQSIIYETTKQALIDSNFSNNKNDNNSMPKTIVIKFGSYRVAFELEELIRKARRQNGTATVTI